MNVLEYNKKHGITPTALNKSNKLSLEAEKKEVEISPYEINSAISLAADPVIQYMSNEELEKSIKFTQKQMEKAAKNLDFIDAARLRDELMVLRAKLKELKG